jgi:hypothetical protein
MPVKKGKIVDYSNIAHREDLLASNSLCQKFDIGLDEALQYPVSLIPLGCP